jgi:hypothetical protein
MKIYTVGSALTRPSRRYNFFLQTTVPDCLKEAVTHLSVGGAPTDRELVEE